jgi:exonuclease III
MGAYEDFTAEQQAVRQRISDMNNTINENRLANAKAMQRYDAAMLAGETDAAGEAREEAKRLDEDLKWVQHDLQVLSENGARNSPVVAAGKRVIAENTKTMAALQAAWDAVAKQMAEHRKAFMEGVAQLGLIAKKAHALRAQLNDVADNSGIAGPWVPSPDDNLNHDKQKGIIYYDLRELYTTFKRGKVK